jgi:hypothetical protein
LTIHDSIGIKDIAGMYPSVEFLDDVETTLATVIPPIVEAAPAEEEAAADGAEPELIRKPAEEDGDDKDKKE